MRTYAASAGAVAVTLDGFHLSVPLLTSLPSSMRMLASAAVSHSSCTFPRTPWSARRTCKDAVIDRPGTTGQFVES